MPVVNKEVKLPAEGMFLEDFIQKYHNILLHKRAFYVVQARIDDGNVCKFGIAGASGRKTSTIDRFKKYIIEYGKNTKNKCRGVSIHFCWLVRYNEEVQVNKTRVFQLELNMKRKLKSMGKILTEDMRGSERVRLPPKTVVAMARSLIPKMRDVPTQRAAMKTNLTQKQMRKVKKEDKKLIVRGPRKGRGENKKLDELYDTSDAKPKKKISTKTIAGRVRKRRADKKNNNN